MGKDDGGQEAKRPAAGDAPGDAPAKRGRTSTDTTFLGVKFFENQNSYLGTITWKKPNIRRGTSFGSGYCEKAQDAARWVDRHTIACYGPDGAKERGLNFPLENYREERWYKALFDAEEKPSVGFFDNESGIDMERAGDNLRRFMQQHGAGSPGSDSESEGGDEWSAAHGVEAASRLSASRYFAMLCWRGARLSGFFTDEEEAARWYDRLLITCIGPAAASRRGLNFPVAEYEKEAFFGALFGGGGGGRAAVGVHSEPRATATAAMEGVKAFLADRGVPGPDGSLPPEPVLTRNERSGYFGVIESHRRPLEARVQWRSARLAVKNWRTAEEAARWHDRVNIACYGPELAEARGLNFPLAEFEREAFFEELFGPGAAVEPPRVGWHDPRRADGEAALARVEDFLDRHRLSSRHRAPADGPAAPASPARAPKGSAPAPSAPRPEQPAPASAPGAAPGAALSSAPGARAMPPAPPTAPGAAAHGSPSRAALSTAAPAARSPAAPVPARTAPASTAPPPSGLARAPPLPLPMAPAVSGLAPAPPALAAPAASGPARAPAAAASAAPSGPARVAPASSSAAQSSPPRTVPASGPPAAPGPPPAPAPSGLARAAAAPAAPAPAAPAPSGPRTNVAPPARAPGPTAPAAAPAPAPRAPTAAAPAASRKPPPAPSQPAGAGAKAAGAAGPGRGGDAGVPVFFVPSAYFPQLPQAVRDQLAALGPHGCLAELCLHCMGAGCMYGLHAQAGFCAMPCPVCHASSSSEKPAAAQG